MKLNRPSVTSGLWILVLLVAGCKLEDPVLPSPEASSVLQGSDGFSITTGTSNAPIDPVNGISAPQILNPLPGTVFTDPQPTLTVRNATSQSGATLSYSFQVARDDAFSSVISEAGNLPGGDGGITSWRVQSLLEAGPYFWRARASGSPGAGPYSAISDFTVRSGSSPSPSPSPSPGSPPGSSGSTVFDPLTNGGTVGQVVGGQFRQEGWQVTHRGNFIRYIVAPLTSGFVEWENLGLSPFNPARDEYTLLGMWDPSRGEYRANPFRVHVRKLDTNGHNRPYVRLRFIAGGEEHDVGNDFLDWEPSRVYQWRLEWGPTGSGNVARLLLDGRVMTSTPYGPSYSPRQHYIELGVEERAESITGVIYRNVSIGPR